MATTHGTAGRATFSLQINYRRSILTGFPSATEANTGQQSTCIIRNPHPASILSSRRLFGDDRGSHLRAWWGTTKTLHAAAALVQKSGLTVAEGTPLSAVAYNAAVPAPERGGICIAVSATGSGLDFSLAPRSLRGW